MFDTLRQWIGGLGDSEGQTIIQALTKAILHANNSIFGNLFSYFQNF
jgi:hypothetical protein